MDAASWGQNLNLPGRVEKNVPKGGEKMPTWSKDNVKDGLKRIV